MERAVLLLGLRVSFAGGVQSLATVAGIELRTAGLKISNSSIETDLARAVVRQRALPEKCRAEGPYLYPQMVFGPETPRYLLLAPDGDGWRVFDAQTGKFGKAGAEINGAPRHPVADLLRHRRVVATRYLAERLRESTALLLSILVFGALATALVWRVAQVVLSRSPLDAAAWCSGLVSLALAIWLTALLVREQRYAPDSALMRLCGQPETSGCGAVLHGPGSQVFGVTLSELGIVAQAPLLALWLCMPPAAPQSLVPFLPFVPVAAFLIYLQVRTGLYCRLCNFVHGLVLLALALSLWRDFDASMLLDPTLWAASALVGLISSLGAAILLLALHRVHALSERMQLLVQTQTVDGAVAALTRLSGSEPRPDWLPLPDIDIPARRPVAHSLYLAVSPLCDHCRVLLALLSDGWLERLRDDFHIQMSFVRLDPDNEDEATIVALLKHSCRQLGSPEGLKTAFALADLTLPLPDTMIAMLKRRLGGSPEDLPDRTEPVPFTPMVAIEGVLLAEHLQVDAVGLVKLLGGPLAP